MEWRRLTQPEEPAFGRAMALYEASFPRHEQRLPDEQRAVLSHPEYHFTQLFDGAEFVGLLLYWEAEDFRYVEHFCVRPELRGRRYGAKALEELGRDGKTVVLEIDPPVDDIARRRQGFYQRCGFAVNPYPHVFPSGEQRGRDARSESAARPDARMSGDQHVPVCQRLPDSGW